MIISGLGDFAFWDYAVEYGIFSEATGELIGFRDDAPAEAKDSWAEAKKIFDEIEKQRSKFNGASQ